MLMPGTRTLLIIGAFVVVCGVGAAGWMKRGDHPVENTAFNPQAGSLPYQGTPGYQAGSGQYQTGGAYAVSASVPQPVYATDGYYPSRMRPIYVRQQEIVEPVVVQQEYTTTSVPRRRVYQEQEYYTDSRGHRRGRTKTHSVEIVAGTAAVGAVIGGLAGGGKGAAIGAVSGGGAGFIYDRLTHNK
jgi:hypothetical protein